MRYTPRGFSLLETIIAIAVLTIAMTAVFTLVSGGIRSVSAASNELTAYFLASEALEYMRNLRDGNLLGGRPAFDDAVFGVCKTFEGCIVDVRAAAGAGILESCDPTLDCPPLRFNTAGVYYNHDTPIEGVNEDTPFTRQVSMTCVTSDPCEEYEVRALVTWRHPLGLYEVGRVGLDTNLFNTAF